MKLKYYLRGLGIGIIVTAVIMGISSGGKTEKLTDAQILARAKELEQENDVLTQLTEAETQELEANAEEEKKELPATETDTQLETAGSEAAKEAAQAEAGKDKPNDPQAENTGDAKTEETVQTEPETEESFVVAVYPGEGSYMICRKLAELGLVESADIYDRFLCQNGYDKRLCTGNFEIKAGSSAEEIAKILTKS